MLQQQHAQLTIKRAASGIMDGAQLSAGGHRGRHSGGPSSLAAGGNGLVVGTGDSSQRVRGVNRVNLCDTRCFSAHPSARGVRGVPSHGFAAVCMWRCITACQQVESSGLSSSGLRRAMLSIKSVAGSTPLSAAAKASIIHTIADSALASFVVIQVRTRCCAVWVKAFCLAVCGGQTDLLLESC